MSRARKYPPELLDRGARVVIESGRPIAHVARDHGVLAPSSATVGSTMAAENRLDIARRSYLAFAAGDRKFFEEHLNDDFTFSSPPHPRLDRDGWFERCWPGAGAGQRFAFRRLIGSGNEVVVTYELRRPDGTGGCNTEVLTFDEQDRIKRTEVYFGWELVSAGPDR